MNAYTTDLTSLKVLLLKLLKRLPFFLNDLSPDWIWGFGANDCLSPDWMEHWKYRVLLCGWALLQIFQFLCLAAGSSWRACHSCNVFAMLVSLLVKLIELTLKRFKKGVICKFVRALRKMPQAKY